MGIAVEMSLLTSLQDDMYAIPYLLLVMAAILDFRLPVMSGRIRNSLIELLDLVSGGLTVEIALLSSLQAEL